MRGVISVTRTSSPPLPGTNLTGTRSWDHAKDGGPDMLISFLVISLATAIGLGVPAMMMPKESGRQYPGV